MRASWRLFAVACILAGAPQESQHPGTKDYATMPITGALDGTGQQNSLLARVNFLREEPGGGRGRFFINDLNGPLYILNKTSRQLIKYLDFNGREGHTGIFHKLSYETGYGAGFINFIFRSRLRGNGGHYP
jgi:hypothetical protein